MVRYLHQRRKLSWRWTNIVPFQTGHLKNLTPAGNTSTYMYQESEGTHRTAGQPTAMARACRDNKKEKNRKNKMLSRRRTELTQQGGGDTITGRRTGQKPLFSKRMLADVRTAKLTPLRCHHGQQDWRSTKLRPRRHHEFETAAARSRRQNPTDMNIKVSALLALNLSQIIDYFLDANAPLDYMLRTHESGMYDWLQWKTDLTTR